MSDTPKRKKMTQTFLESNMLRAMKLNSMHTPFDKALLLCDSAFKITSQQGHGNMPTRVFPRAAPRVREMVG